MSISFRHGRPTIGILAGWQFYRTATNLSYLAPLYRGISKASRDLDCNLLFGCGMGPSASPTDPVRPAWPGRLPGQDYVPIDHWNTDGLIIVVPLHSQARSAYVQEMIAAGRHVLFIGSGENGPTFVADNQGGITDAMAHLVAHGNQKIAFIAGSQDDLNGDTGERLWAFQHFCKNQDLSQDPRLIAFGQHFFSGGYHAMREILASGVEFTAVLASNDESALGAIEALTEASLKVPDDVAVIGFDNRLEGAAHKPGLTSVHVPLFNIGYQAGEALVKCLVDGTPLPPTVNIGTRLIIRQSCGCNKNLEELNAAKSYRQARPVNQPNQAIAKIIMNQAYSLTEDESLSLGDGLMQSFWHGVQTDEWGAFYHTLTAALQHTEEGGDPVHLWQDVITFIAGEVGLQPHPAPSPTVKAKLDEARKIISSKMQRQHIEYVIKERWTSSRLSLLTAELLTALEPAQIFQILAKRLPDMKIQTAWLSSFDLDEDELTHWSVARDLNKPEQEPVRFLSREFPPREWLDESQTFRFTLIPLVDQSGQLGYMAFDVEQLELYGAIVQQVGSALNTARLYQQATEGRRLAEEANRMKSRFLSTISHELRTPLNLIVGLSGLLLREGESDQPDIPQATQHDIQRIHAYAQHLGGLIGDVIDLATLDAGQFRLNKELIDFGETLQLVVESGSQMAADKELEWYSDIPRNGPWVLGDRTRLRQVVLNLINNAIKFTPQGKVALSLQSDDDLVTVSVKDTGLGIPPEEQDAIFEAFQRSERSITLGYPGLGLGLAICKMLVEMHAGTLELHSSGVAGQGSEFVLTLPVEIPKDAQKDKAEKPYTSSALILSSQTGLHQRLLNLLNQRGIEVHELSIENPSAWQEKTENGIPDIIVLDVTEQSHLSWKTLKAIKENQVTKHVLIFLYAISANGESLINLDYVTKPVEVDELIQALDQHWGTLDAARSVRTILIVDDEPDTLELHARIVQSQSTANRALLASSGIQALEILQMEHIDLVLLDLQMPEMDGFDVLEAMGANKNTREIPVIVVTGKVLTEEDIERLNRGVAVVLQKGLFNTNETVAHIQSALERKHNLGAETKRLVRQAMVYIHTHYADAISRQDLAQHINISEDYLTYCFRQELGTTPIKYLQRYRVNQAKSLLKDSQKTITEIALDVGFSDSGYFSRIFHRETGMSPEQFRRS